MVPGPREKTWKEKGVRKGSQEVLPLTASVTGHHPARVVRRELIVVTEFLPFETYR